MSSWNKHSDLWFYLGVARGRKRILSDSEGEEEEGDKKLKVSSVIDSDKEEEDGVPTEGATEGEKPPEDGAEAAAVVPDVSDDSDDGVNRDERE